MKDEFYPGDPNCSRLDKRPVCELRIRRSPTNPPLQPAHMPPLPDSFFVGGLSDSARVPIMRKDAEPPNMAGADFGSRLFRVLLAVPVKTA